MNKMWTDISYFNTKEVLNGCLENMKSRITNADKSVIYSGFCWLDNLIGGFENGKVYVIGGRICSWREDFMLSMINNIALENKQPILLFSTKEMRHDYLYRLMSIRCKIPTFKLSKGILHADEWIKLDEEVDIIYDAPLFIHDSLDLSLNELMETARNCIMRKGIKIIFIDCLQLIDFTKEITDPPERIARVMHTLKQLASMTKLPIVVGSMLNRGVDRRDGIYGKRPQLKDLPNSIYIDEFADTVMMVHYPDFYHVHEDYNRLGLHGKMGVIVRKNEFGPLGETFLEYRQDTGLIYEEKMSGTDNKSNEKLFGSPSLVEDETF